jgi:outer membrane protein assembly factor BamB
MILMRLAIVMLLLVPGLALGQAKDDKDKDKVSNDDPGRPLQMPPASTETKEALEDFDRFQRRGAWERALKSLYTIPDDQARRFVDGEKGFIIPVERRRRSILSALPPAGQAACRLFYDAEAKKLLDEADGASELKNLERVYSAYFITTVGDNAADRLGDLYFEQGRFDRAADCWLSVLRERPDTDLSPALLAVKAALALDRAGRRSELEQVRSELADRYRDEKVTIAGRTGPAVEVLRRLLGEDEATSAASLAAAHPDPPGPDLAHVVDPAWQLRIADSIEAGMTPVELGQWRTNMLSAAVPVVAVDGGHLYVNYLSHILALDLEAGKLLWRTGSFHNLELLAMQPAGQMLDPSRFAIFASGEHVWTLARDVKDPNMMAPFQLTCRRADNGEVVWKSSDLADYAAFELVGMPMLADGKLFVTAKTAPNPQQPQMQNQPQQLVLAIQPHDGKILWKTEVGTFRQGQRWFFYYYRRDDSPQPRLSYRSGAVYVDTHIGVLGRLDPDSGALDWGYGYKTDPYQSSYSFWYYYQPREPTVGPSPPLSTGEALLIKGMQSDRLYAIDPDRMKVLWERPIAKASRLLGADDRTLYLGGAELGAIDLKTRSLLWSTPLPGGSMDCRVLVRFDGLWQLTPRGIYEIDPASGEMRRIFRGKDLGSVGGDLVLTDRWLLSISNKAITAYPRRAERAEVSARVEPATTKEKATP